MDIREFFGGPPEQTTPPSVLTKKQQHVLRTLAGARGMVGGPATDSYVMNQARNELFPDIGRP